MWFFVLLIVLAVILFGILIVNRRFNKEYERELQENKDNPLWPPKW